MLTVDDFVKLNNMACKFRETHGAFSYQNDIRDILAKGWVSHEFVANAAMIADVEHAIVDFHEKCKKNLLTYQEADYIAFIDHMKSIVRRGQSILEAARKEKLIKEQLKAQHPHHMNKVKEVWDKLTAQSDKLTPIQLTYEERSYVKVIELALDAQEVPLNVSQKMLKATTKVLTANEKINMTGSEEVIKETTYLISSGELSANIAILPPAKPVDPMMAFVVMEIVKTAITAAFTWVLGGIMGIFGTNAAKKSEAPQDALTFAKGNHPKDAKQDQELVK